MKKHVFLIAFILNAIALMAQNYDDKLVVSSLYVYDLKAHNASLVIRKNRHFEAPNWSGDGKYFLINAYGKLERISLKGDSLGPLYAGNIISCNNDHGYSFDGKTLYISAALPDVKSGSSFVFKLPSNGGDPIQLTPKTPSYWHGISPDGKTIVYCAERNGNFDVYSMSSNGGEETRLTNNEGLDDGPEFSPDGKYIYFNSFRNGMMQIWRMQPDGSSQEQMTFDAHSNWFAHINPNGKVATIITYMEDQVQQHPFGKQVTIRLLDLTSKKIIDLTGPFFGGQGTINVPSWSPDGKKFAFVKYELTQDR